MKFAVPLGDWVFVAPMGPGPIVRYKVKRSREEGQYVCQILERWEQQSLRKIDLAPLKAGTEEALWNQLQIEIAKIEGVGGVGALAFTTGFYIESPWLES